VVFIHHPHVASRVAVWANTRKKTAGKKRQLDTGNSTTGSKQSLFYFSFPGATPCFNYCICVWSTISWLRFDCYWTNTGQPFVLCRDMWGNVYGETSKDSGGYAPL